MKIAASNPASEKIETSSVELACPTAVNTVGNRKIERNAANLTNMYEKPLAVPAVFRLRHHGWDGHAVRRGKILPTHQDRSGKRQNEDLPGVKGGGGHQKGNEDRAEPDGGQALRWPDVPRGTARLVIATGSVCGGSPSEGIAPVARPPRHRSADEALHDLSTDRRSGHLRGQGIHQHGQRLSLRAEPPASISAEATARPPSPRSAR